MMTYAEKLGVPPFNWFEALNKPDDEIEWDELIDRASGWITCAVGNQCSIIPRDIWGEPKDQVLSRLGNTFFNKILKSKAKPVLKTLHDIEERSAYLINQIKEQQ